MLKPGNVRSAMIPDINRCVTPNSDGALADAFPAEAGPTMGVACSQRNGRLHAALQEWLGHESRMRTCGTGLAMRVACGPVGLA